MNSECQFPKLVGDGYCQDYNNNYHCGFDQGDCCGSCVNTDHCTDCVCKTGIKEGGINNPIVGDGYCQDSTNNADCNFDGGDCCGSCKFTKFCTDCECRNNVTGINPLVGNGICDDLTNNPYCGFDGLDCCPYPNSHGNGICTDYNNFAECNFDGGDCCGPHGSTVLYQVWCTECKCHLQDTCEVPLEMVGNGYCNDEANNAECHYDNGDCCGSCVNKDNCTECACIGGSSRNDGIPNIKVGDGYCNDETNNEECNYDGGDCCGSCINTLYCSECQCVSGLNNIPGYF